MPEPPSYPPQLAELARLHGIQTAYRDVFGRRRAASETALLASLEALGAPVSGRADVDDALRERQRALISQLAPPVVVAWGDRAARVELRVPPELDGYVSAHLCLEDGEERHWTDPASVWPAIGAEEAAGLRRVVRRMVVPGRLPFGYHRLRITAGDHTAVTLLVCAPPAAPGAGEPERSWGGFIPVYALRSERNWGVGDLTDLRELLEWIRSQGGRMAAALPFFADFYDEPFDPSPYSPATRLFWNELHLDIASVPDLAVSSEARELIASPGMTTELAQLRGSGTVEYLRVMTAKRRVLDLLSRAVSGDRLRDVEGFAASDPLLEDYARFRAACERLGRPWTSWPAGPRSGTLSDADIDGNGYRYHRYVQWLMHEQLGALAGKDAGGPLYLDLPIGVNPSGFDVWRERECFVAGASAGAPPDAVFTKGQDWGFPPMHPDGIRETGYRYPAECFRRMMRYAGLLRIDHVMGMHRLYVIPPGLEASQGAYIRYPADELYAVLALEAHRAGARVLGEDLGTVPGYVRTAMDKHGVHHSYVVQYELATGEKLRTAGPRDVASINTHDMPTFAAWWEGADVDDRLDLGLIDEEAAAGEREQRGETCHLLVQLLGSEGFLGLEETPAAAEVLRACLAFLAAGEAPMVVVTLEDLWLEHQPQNVPGTTSERPNWRRKARLTLADMRGSAEVAAILQEVDRRRGALR